MAMPVPEGAVMEEAPIDKIDDFESLDQYAASNPMPETPAETPPDLSAESPSSEATFEYPSTPESSFETSPTPEASFETSPQPEFPLEPQPAEPQLSESQFIAASPEPESQASPQDFAATQDFQASTELQPPQEALSPPPPQNPPPTQTTIDKIKNYSDRVQVAKPAVPAAFPFSLLIIGDLLPHEKDKLLDILSRENMGIREIDLEFVDFAGLVFSFGSDMPTQRMILRASFLTPIKNPLISFKKSRGIN